VAHAGASRQGGRVKELFRRRVALVTGKGGVGRTTMTAAIAIAGAKLGKRVLVTELADPEVEYTPLARLFGRERLPAEPVELAPNVRGCCLYFRRGHELFFHTVLPIAPLVNAALSSSALRKMLEAAPSLVELGVFYHLLTLMTAERRDGSPEYDLIIIDMPASGHTLGLTGLPERILEVMPRGPIARAMREGQAMMYDPEFSGTFIITLPEVLPVTESLELAEGLAAHNVQVAGIFLNRFIDDTFTADERAVLAPVLEDREVYGKSRFLASVRAEESEQRLREGTNARIVRVPELEDQGRDLIEHIASVLVEAN
jgi:arsenite/tail-anchored protein-transporting ATPase